MHVPMTETWLIALDGTRTVAGARTSPRSYEEIFPLPASYRQIFRQLGLWRGPQASTTRSSTPPCVLQAVGRWSRWMRENLRSCDCQPRARWLRSGSPSVEVPGNTAVAARNAW